MESSTVRVPIYKRGGIVVAHMLVDAENAPFVNQRRWSLSTHGYAQASFADAGCTLAQRLIMGAQPFQIVDHVNGDKLDNRRSNLRFANKQENNANRRKNAGCSSRFKGVCLHTKNRNWNAYIKKDGKRKHIGCFQDEEAAARAYDAAARELFGEFAHLNFPD